MSRRSGPPPEATEATEAPPPWRVLELPRPAADTSGTASGRAADPAPHAGSTRRGEPDPRRKALALLTRREHSRRELKHKLAARGFTPDAAEAAVADMAERGWQDDARFAESLARSRALAGHGPLRIRLELQQHGIAAECIAQALAAARDAIGMDWPDWATAVLQRRFGDDAAASQREIARRGAFLQRRGFPPEAITHALREHGSP